MDLLRVVLTVAVHLGDGSPHWVGDDEWAFAIVIMETFFFAHRPLWCMVFGGVLERHPDLRVVFTESGADWVPDLFKGLKSAKEGGEALLDRTMVLYGSNLGDANAHSTTNLPTLFAGGGFKHGRHLAFDRARNYPLPNLFMSMLQRLGIEAASFGPSTGTMRGLEVV